MKRTGLRTHQKYDAVLISAYNGTMNKIRTISEEHVNVYDALTLLITYSVVRIS